MHFLFCLLFFSLLTSQSLIDFSMLLIAITGIIYFGRSPFNPLRVLNLSIPLTALIVIVGIGLLPYLPSPEAWKNLLEFRWILELWFLALVFSQIRDWDKLFKFITAFLGFSTLAALIFYFIGLNPILLLKEGATAADNLAEPRLGGFFGHSMPFAHTYSLAFLLAAGYFLNQRKKLHRTWQIIGGLTLICAFLSLLFSYSRGVWIAIAVAVLAALILTKNKTLLKALAIGAVLAGVVFTTFPDLQYRLSTTAQATAGGDEKRKVLLEANWLIFKDHPLIGIGYGYNKFRLREYYDKMNIPAGYFEAHAHNQYLQFLSGTGILGLSFFLWFTLLLLYQNHQLLRQTTDTLQRGILTGTLMAQISFLVGGLTEANFSIAKNRAMYLFVIAIFLALKTQRSQSEPQTSA